jgi:hypothetical protein
MDFDKRERERQVRDGFLLVGGILPFFYYYYFFLYSILSFISWRAFSFKKKFALNRKNFTLRGALPTHVESIHKQEPQQLNNGVANHGHCRKYRVCFSFSFA